MATVRLLRQSVEDYEKKVAGANQNYEANHAAYAGQVDAYNTLVKSGTPLATPNANGTYTLPSGQTVSLSSELPRDDDFSAVFDTKYMKNADGSITTYNSLPGGYQAGETYKLIPPTPSAPAAPQEIREPNLTEKDKGLLQNPTATPNQMVMAANTGAVAKSALAGEQPLSTNSAFRNPDDPNNLKERGVLARVMGGQL